MANPATTPYTALALGSFDGLHLGHRAVLQAALQQKAAGLLPCALLFDEHPQQVLRGTAPPELLSPGARNDLLRAWGLVPLTIAFADVQALDAERFVRDLLVDTLQARAVCCGYNYRFAAGGTGDVATLRQLCEQYGIRLTVVPAVEYGGEAVSSTRIRDCLLAGDLPAANAMLARPFSYKRTVVSGDKRGRLLGAPTINQLFPAQAIIPRHGVYASKTFVDAQWHASVTNIGVRPTFRLPQPRSETCILNYSGNLYGEDVEVALLQFLRPEQKFAGEDALRTQIRQDARAAAAVFAQGAHR